MELWDVYDKNRKPLGKIHTRGIAMPPGEFHIVIEIFTINHDGRLLLTQRDVEKTHPLLWESTGGSITTGETSLEGALRELEEETGLKADADELVSLGELNRGHYFLDSYIWKSTEPIQMENLTLQKGEVCDAKFVTTQDLVLMNQEGLIVPAVWERYMLYRKEIEQSMNQKVEEI
ncbi:NUDIX domain-containing protein [Planococcus sp. N028]|uniref:NUDIX domain-containing protein n=1 Tax=Planococcus shixiaomingii TaxID=3058393 RepID=A0ABT8N4G0_9BACL|nr:NUDIX domain-containing protein [Planococcus sp. N028]MDN7242771.1 NUDIX domain-containing protein [Planococcus sp. N028]